MIPHHRYAPSPYARPISACRRSGGLAWSIFTAAVDGSGEGGARQDATMPRRPMEELLAWSSLASWRLGVHSPAVIRLRHAHDTPLTSGCVLHGPLALTVAAARARGDDHISGKGSARDA